MFVCLFSTLWNIRREVLLRMTEAMEEERGEEREEGGEANKEDG